MLRLVGDLRFSIPGRKGHGMLADCTKLNEMQSTQRTDILNHIRAR